MEKVLSLQEREAKNQELGSRRLIVHNLGLEWTTESLTRFFSNYGEIERISLNQHLQNLEEITKFECKITFKDISSIQKVKNCSQVSDLGMKFKTILSVKTQKKTRSRKKKLNKRNAKTSLQDKKNIQIVRSPNSFEMRKKIDLNFTDPNLD